MGIKDWFGGDKKKAQFRDKVKEAVSGGKLSSADLEKLETLRKELEVEDPADDKTQLRRDIYNRAVAAVKAGGQLGTAEAAELAKIQKFLALSDDQVEKTRRNLTRFRTLTEIREGTLPTVPTSNVALRGVQFEPGEVAHYCVSAELLDQPATGREEGIRAQWNARYEVDSVLALELPAEGAKPLGQGNLIVTNRRLIFKGDPKSAAVKFAPDAQIYLYTDGIRLQRTMGNTLLRYRAQSEETAEIIAELVFIFMR